MSQTHTRVSLAYQDLSELPMEFMLKYGDWLDELDLTYNRISDLRFLTHFPLLNTLIIDHNCIQSHAKFPILPELNTLWLNRNEITNLDLRFLCHFPILSTLILDHNSIRSHVKMPVMTELHTLWLNHNEITNLGVFVNSIAKSCPKLKYLSMMNNDAAPSYFNGGTYQQYIDYRQYVISQIPSLEILDDKCITPEERREAEKIYQRAILQSTRRAKRSGNMSVESSPTSSSSNFVELSVSELNRMNLAFQDENPEQYIYLALDEAAKAGSNGWKNQNGRGSVESPPSLDQVEMAIKKLMEQRRKVPTPTPTAIPE